MSSARRFCLYAIPLLVLLVLLQFGDVPAKSEPGAIISGQVAMASMDVPAVMFCYQGHISNPRLVVVDKSLQRVMVFRYAGKMLLEQEYPCATGENEGDKLEAGDERTPVGIYFTTHRYNDKKVTIFGDKALHLNYPNVFDQLDGRKGDGIYIHGTNRPLKPRSSNGCIVMRNEDLHEVEPLIRDNLTPVVVVERLSWPQLEGRIQACRLADGLDVKTLAGATAIFPPTAGLRKGNESPTVGAPDAETLARLEKSLYGKIKVKTNGLAIYGHRGQWVVVVDQALNKGKSAAMNVSRRLYLTGQEPQDARMLQSYWVLADKSAWHRIKSWAPPVMVASQKKVAVAQPKKVKKAASPPPAPEPQTAGKQKSPRGEVVDTLQDWIKAWSGKHLEAYLSFYAPEFKTDKMDIKAWGKQKAYLNQVYKKITVKADKVKVDIKGDRAKVAFRQHYRSDWHKDVGYKQLELVKRNGRWLIVSETWRPIDSSEAG